MISGGGADLSAITVNTTSDTLTWDTNNRAGYAEYVHSNGNMLYRVSDNAPSLADLNNAVVKMYSVQAGGIVELLVSDAGGVAEETISEKIVYNIGDGTIMIFPSDIQGVAAKGVYFCHMGDDIGYISAMRIPGYNFEHCKINAMYLPSSSGNNYHVIFTYVPGSPYLHALGGDFEEISRDDLEAVMGRPILLKWIGVNVYFQVNFVGSRMDDETYGTVMFYNPYAAGGAAYVYLFTKEYTSETT